MSRHRSQHIGSFKRVPSYCYPTRRRFPTRWFLSLAVAIAWLLVLENQESGLRFEPRRVVVVEAVDVTLVTPEIDTLRAEAYRDAELELGPVAPEQDETSRTPRPAARDLGPALQAAPASRQSPPGEGGGDHRSLPVAALPAAGPRSPAPPSSGDEADHEALARTALASPTAAGLRNRRPDARDTSPLGYDCLTLCGRGPPSRGEAS